MQAMQVAPWSSFVDVGFWSVLAKRKLESYRLSDASRPLVATFATGHEGKGQSAPAHITLSADSLDAELSGDAALRPPAYQFAAPGSLRNFNSLEEFKACDKAAVLAAAAAQVWSDVQSGAALQEPALLNRFAVVAYADLKSWKFHYWFCFPALLLLSDAAYFADPVPLSSALSETQVEQLREGYARLRGLGTSEGQASGQPPPFFLAALKGASLRVEPLSSYPSLSDADEVLLGFADPCCLPANPGWPVRNLLVLAAAKWQLSRVRVIAFRERPGRPDASASLLLSVTVVPPGAALPQSAETPKAAGWERAAAGALAPRVADLGPAMDPARLAEGAVDLNVRLMRWRLAPDVQPDRLAATRCLLLGAGTLGCAVARTLLGWGVRRMTLVDSGRVAYSNPVRQSLFTFADCAGGGAPKAPAAAARLAEIFPGVVARGVQLAIPMPGHPIGDREREAAASALAELDRLVAEHDVVFLLTDTRESRWLPTLLAAAHGKLAINSALGFDSYLVMRHGVLDSGAASSSSSTPPPRLGCYFCNDIVAPKNSVADRTLDQQCTVTRPGLAFAAGAAAVELAVALLHHPRGAAAPAPGGAGGREEAGGGSPLGLVPHQIRGFLSHWTTALVAGRAFDQCTACSGAAVAAYRARGFDFLLDACNDPRYLAELTGLGELQRAAEAAAAAVELEGEAGPGGSDGDDF